MNEQAAIVFLSLGSNMGDKEKNLLNAIHAIRNIPQTVLLGTSKMWTTEAWGKTNQDDFINAVVSIETYQSPELLMGMLITIEEKLGRVRNEKWGPRIIDIDILFFGELILKTEKLIIPHPEMQNRKFVLVPLNEICPELIHPVYKKTIANLLLECDDKCVVSQLNNSEKQREQIK